MWNTYKIIFTNSSKNNERLGLGICNEEKFNYAARLPDQIHIMRRFPITGYNTEATPGVIKSIAAAPMWEKIFVCICVCLLGCLINFLPHLKELEKEKRRKTKKKKQVVMGSYNIRWDVKIDNGTKRH